MASSITNNVSKTVQFALESGKYSDFTIKCHGSVFKVHRVVVLPQSKPLAAAIDGSFKEAITGEIDLEDDEPAVVKSMIDFFYKSDYSGPVNITHENESGKNLLFHTKVYIIADKNDVQELKQLSKEKYTSVVSQAWNTEGFVQSIALMYTQTMDTDRLLKDVAIFTCHSHQADLLKRPDFCEMLKETGEVGHDLLKAATPFPPPVARVNATGHQKCPACSRWNADPRSSFFYCTRCLDAV